MRRARLPAPRPSVSSGRTGTARRLVAALGPLPALGLLLAAASSPAQESHPREATPATTASLPAPVESSDYLAYTSYPEMVDFLTALEVASPEMRVDTIAWLTGERPPEGAGDPALLLVSLGRMEPAGRDRSPRVSVLIIASQHGDEQAGKEAALRVVRDLVAGPLNPLLDAMDVFVVPMPNPWGAAAGQRENARGFDLNRDHGRLQTPATAGLHAFFAQRRPDVVLDLHELGLAAYDAEIGLPTHPNADSALIKFGRYRIMPYVANELARSGFSFHEYVLALPESGPGTEGVERYFTYGPLLASYARNAFALRGAISMLFEVASSREIHDLDRRTAVHYTALRAALEVIADAGDEIRERTAAARRRADEWQPGTAVTDPATTEQRTFVLRATYESDPRQPALTWLVREPEGINTGTTDRWKPAIQPSLLIRRPAGYLIDAEQTELIATLLLHGFEISRLTRARRVRLGSYPHEESRAPGVEPDEADARVIWTEEEVPTGTVYVDLRQPASLLIMAILEPWSQDSWFEGNRAVRRAGTQVFPVSRVETPLSGGMTPVPAGGSDGILGGP